MKRKTKASPDICYMQEKTYSVSSGW